MEIPEKINNNLTFDLTLALPDNVTGDESQELRACIQRAIMVRLDCFSRLLNLMISNSDLKHWQVLDSSLIQLAFNLEVGGLNGATDCIKEQISGVNDLAI